MEKIKAKKLRHKHLGKLFSVGDKFNGLYGDLDRVDMSVDDVEVYVYLNQYGCGGHRMTLSPGTEVWVDTK